MEVYEQFMRGLLQLGNFCFAAVAINALADGFTDLFKHDPKPWSCLYCMSFWFTVCYCIIFSEGPLAGLFIWNISLVFAAKFRS